MVWWGLKKPGLERIRRNVVTMKKRCVELAAIAEQFPCHGYETERHNIWW